MSSSGRDFISDRSYNLEELNRKGFDPSIYDCKGISIIRNKLIKIKTMAETLVIIDVEVELFITLIANR